MSAAMSDAAPDAGAEGWGVGADWTLGSEDTARIIGTVSALGPSRRCAWGSLQSGRLDLVARKNP